MLEQKFITIVRTDIINMASKQQFKPCASPCPRYITGGGECEHCERLSLRMLHSHRALFDEDTLARIPCGSGPAAAEAHWRLL